MAYGGRFGGPRKFGPREMHKATCADCGAECEVPFAPTEGRPVYCRDCWQKRRGQRKPKVEAETKPVEAKPEAQPAENQPAEAKTRS